MAKNKLRQQRGAALLYAMLFFLFCSLVGTIVVTAAAANAGKAAKMREEQQEYLAVRSAAQLVADMMSTGTFRGYFTAQDELIETVTDVGGIKQSVTVHVITFLGGETGYEVKKMECLPGEIQAAIGNLYLQNASYNNVGVLTKLSNGGSVSDVSGDAKYRVPREIKSTFQVAVDGLPAVEVTIEISQGGDGRLPIYSATITAVSDSGNYRLVLDGIATLTPSMQRGSAGNVTTVKSGTTIAWKDWEARKDVGP